jgi:hypothetical protein
LGAVGFAGSAGYSAAKHGIIGQEKLMVTKFPIVWVKMICKYFRVDKEELDMERGRSYFPKDRENPGGRTRLVPMDQKIFEIKPKKR